MSTALSSINRIEARRLGGLLAEATAVTRQELLVEYQPRGPFAWRVISSGAIIGFIRTDTAGYFVARSVGNHLEAADIRRFPTRPGATRWLLSSGQRRTAA